MVAGGLAVLFAGCGEGRARMRLRRAAGFGLAAVVPFVLYCAVWSTLSSVEQAVLKVFEQVATYGLVSRPHICPRFFWWQTLVRNPGFAALGLGGLVALGRRYRDLRAVGRLVVVYSSVLLALCLWHKQPCPYFFVLLIPTLFVVVAGLEASPPKLLIANYRLKDVPKPIVGFLPPQPRAVLG